MKMYPWHLFFVLKSSSDFCPPDKTSDLGNSTNLFSIKKTCLWKERVKRVFRLPKGFLTQSLLTDHPVYLNVFEKPRRCSHQRVSLYHWEENASDFSAMDNFLYSYRFHPTMEERKKILSTKAYLCIKRVLFSKY